MKKLEKVQDQNKETLSTFQIKNNSMKEPKERKIQNLHLFQNIISRK